MNREQKMYRGAYWLASLIIALVMLSGYQKAFHPAEFSVAVYRFQLLPGGLVNLAALYLPWLEIMSALFLLFVPRYRVAALWIILFLLLIFTAAIGINLWRGTSFGCGCFGRGAADHPMSWLNIARNVGLMLLTELALLSRRKIV